MLGVPISALCTASTRRSGNGTSTAAPHPRRRAASGARTEQFSPRSGLVLPSFCVRTESFAGAHPRFENLHFLDIVFARQHTRFQVRSGTNEEVTMSRGRVELLSLS